MSRIDRYCEINEELDLNLYYRAFDCPHCCGGMAQSGEYGDEWETCDECDGDGVLYLKDSKPCDRCNTKIYFNQIAEKWIPFEAATDERHHCPVL